MTNELKVKRLKAFAKALREKPDTPRARHYPLNDVKVRLGIEESLEEWLDLPFLKDGKVTEIVTGSHPAKADAYADYFESLC